MNYVPKNPDFPCAQCGKVFQRYHSSVKFCCEECRRVYRRSRQREWYANLPPEAVQRRKALKKRYHEEHLAESRAYQIDYYYRVQKPARQEARMEKARQEQQAWLAAAKSLLLEEIRRKNAGD